MQPDTYILLHRMLGAATTKNDLEIALRQFQIIINAYKNSSSRDELFDAAWAMSCAAGLYLRLNEPFLAERTYVESIRLFDKNRMAGNSAVLCVALAKMLVQLGRTAEAEEQLRDNVRYLAKFWGETNHYVVSANEELRHFQQTGEIIEAARHLWCKPCGVDKYGVGFDQNPMQAPEVDDIWPQ